VNRIVALVGMTGSGKSTVSDMLVEKGFKYLRFGQITLDEIRRRGLQVSEENERTVREELRKEYGMAAFATLNLLNIEELLDDGNVVADGLYSWEEYLVLKENFGESLIILAVYASPETRYARLVNRTLDPEKDTARRFRKTTREESMSRDVAEIENLHKAGPIAMADCTLINEYTIEELKAQVEEFLKKWL
jgi:dephospho-CoA kinase